MIEDFRSAIRMAFRRPAFALVTIVTIGVGIATNATIFTVVKAVLIDSLPYAEAARIVEITSLNKQHPEETWPVSYPDFQDWERGAGAFDAIAMYSTPHPMNLGRSEEEAVPVRTEFVTSRYFEVLALAPVAGRMFLPAEDVPGEHAVAVLSHSLWRDTYGSDPDVVGSLVQLDGRSHEVVGVAPAGFAGISDQADLWVPATMAAVTRGDIFTFRRRLRWLYGIGRLRDGVSTPDARADLNVVAAMLAETYPDSNKEIGVRLTPLADRYVRDLRAGLMVLVGAAGFLLLIVCANVANLFLVDAVRRSNEVALRVALGAGPGASWGSSVGVRWCSRSPAEWLGFGWLPRSPLGFCG